MKSLLRTFSALTLAASTLFWSASASALWMGLADGDYDVTLTTCNSSDPAICAGFPLQGSFTVSGSGVSHLNFTIDGVLFDGDPTDFVQDPFINPGDIRERSTFNHVAPGFDFIGFLHAVGPVLPPVINEWIYCQDIPASNSCTLIAGGAWVATPKAVPEPTTGLLLVLGAAGLGFVRRWRTR